MNLYIYKNKKNNYNKNNFTLVNPKTIIIGIIDTVPTIFFSLFSTFQITEKLNFVCVGDKY